MSESVNDAGAGSHCTSTKKQLLFQLSEQSKQLARPLRKSDSCEKAYTAQNCYNPLLVNMVSDFVFHSQNIRQ